MKRFTLTSKTVCEVSLLEKMNGLLPPFKITKRDWVQYHLSISLSAGNVNRKISYLLYVVMLY